MASAVTALKTGTRDPEEARLLSSTAPPPTPGSVPFLQWLGQTRSRLVPSRRDDGRGSVLEVSRPRPSPSSCARRQPLLYLPRPSPCGPPPQPHLPSSSSSCSSSRFHLEEGLLPCILTVAKIKLLLRAGSLGWLDEPEETKIDILILPCSPGSVPLPAANSFIWPQHSRHYAFKKKKRLGWGSGESPAEASKITVLCADSLIAISWNADYFWPSFPCPLPSSQHPT